MVSFLVLLFLLLPLCVEDSPASVLPLTRIKRHENFSTENSLDIDRIEATTNQTQASLKENENITSTRENTTHYTESVTTAYSSSPTYPAIQANSVYPEQSNTTDLDVDLSSKYPVTEESSEFPKSEELTTENEPEETTTADNPIENLSTTESSSAKDTSESSTAEDSSETSTIDNLVTDDLKDISTPVSTEVGDLSESPEPSTEYLGTEPTRNPKFIDITDNSEITTDNSETTTDVSETATDVSETTTEAETANTSTPPSTTTNDLSSTDEDNGTNVGLVIGIIIAILLIGVCLVLWRAHRSGRLPWPPKSLFSNGLSDPVRPQAVALKKFPAHCSEMLNIPSKLSHEYQLLATLSLDIYATESFVAGQLPDNKFKNRYVNILPFDSTRVKLASEGEEFFSDYMNASYIKGYTNDVEYIATQGPKEETCRDFWKMVYQEPIKVIIMVTQLEEQGKPKCYKYYPDLRENMELEDIVVRCTTELHFPIYTSRTLILTKGERKRSIIHLHFREWPDFGCPATPDLMLQFCQVMRHNIVLAQPGITLIHCSAGVGRTGTLIAVDILLQHIKENKKIDIFGTVYKLRKHRMNMVQSEAQYVYIYKCIKEALEDPSYLSSENSSTTSLEPIYENIECTRLSRVSNKVVQEAVISENECAL